MIKKIYPFNKNNKLYLLSQPSYLIGYKGKTRKGRVRMKQLLDEQQAVTEALSHWCDHLSNKQLENLVQLYEPSAVLLPTLADNMITNHQDRLAYFTLLMQNPNFKVEVEESNVRIVSDVAINSGFYTFSFDKDGNRVKIPSRFTFIYKKKPTGWMIIDHHSSQIPQS